MFYKILTNRLTFFRSLGLLSFLSLFLYLLIVEKNNQDHKLEYKFEQKFIEMAGVQLTSTFTSRLDDLKKLSLIPDILLVIAPFNSFNSSISEKFASLASRILLILYFNTSLYQEKDLKDLDTPRIEFFRGLIFFLEKLLIILILDLIVIQISLYINNKTKINKLLDIISRLLNIWIPVGRTNQYSQAISFLTNQEDIIAIFLKWLVSPFIDHNEIEALSISRVFIDLIEVLDHQSGYFLEKITQELNKFKNNPNIFLWLMAVQSQIYDQDHIPLEGPLTGGHRSSDPLEGLVTGGYKPMIENLGLASYITFKVDQNSTAIVPLSNSLADGLGHNEKNFLDLVEKIISSDLCLKSQAIESKKIKDQNQEILAEIIQIPFKYAFMAKLIEMEKSIRASYTNDRQFYRPIRDNNNKIALKQSRLPLSNMINLLESDYKEIVNRGLLIARSMSTEQLKLKYFEDLTADDSIIILKDIKVNNFLKINDSSDEVKKITVEFRDLYQSIIELFSKRPTINRPLFRTLTIAEVLNDSLFLHRSRSIDDIVCPENQVALHLDRFINFIESINLATEDQLEDTKLVKNKEIINSFLVLALRLTLYKTLEGLDYQSTKTLMDSINHHQLKNKINLLSTTKRNQIISRLKPLESQALSQKITSLKTKLPLNFKKSGLVKEDLLEKFAKRFIDIEEAFIIRGGQKELFKDLNPKELVDKVLKDLGLFLKILTDCQSPLISFSLLKIFNYNLDCFLQSQFFYETKFSSCSSPIRPLFRKKFINQPDCLLIDSLRADSRILINFELNNQPLAIPSKSLQTSNYTKSKGRFLDYCQDLKKDFSAISETDLFKYWKYFSIGLNIIEIFKIILIIIFAFDIDYQLVKNSQVLRLISIPVDLFSVLLTSIRPENIGLLASFVLILLILLVSNELSLQIIRYFSKMVDKKARRSKRLLKKLIKSNLEQREFNLEVLVLILVVSFFNLLFAGYLSLTGLLIYLEHFLIFSINCLLKYCLLTYFIFGIKTGISLVDRSIEKCNKEEQSPWHLIEMILRGLSRDTGKNSSKTLLNQKISQLSQYWRENCLSDSELLVTNLQNSQNDGLLLKTRTGEAIINILQKKLASQRFATIVLILVLTIIKPSILALPIFYYFLKSLLIGLNIEGNLSGLPKWVLYPSFIVTILHLSEIIKSLVLAIITVLLFLLTVSYNSLDSFRLILSRTNSLKIILIALAIAFFLVFSKKELKSIVKSISLAVLLIVLISYLDKIDPIYKFFKKLFRDFFNIVTRSKNRPVTFGAPVSAPRCIKRLANFFREIGIFITSESTIGDIGGFDREATIIKTDRDITVTIPAVYEDFLALGLKTNLEAFKSKIEQPEKGLGLFKDATNDLKLDREDYLGCRIKELLDLHQIALKEYPEGFSQELEIQSNLQETKRNFIKWKIWPNRLKSWISRALQPTKTFAVTSQRPGLTHKCTSTRQGASEDGCLAEEPDLLKFSEFKEDFSKFTEDFSKVFGSGKNAEAFSKVFGSGKNAEAFSKVFGSGKKTQAQLEKTPESSSSFELSDSTKKKPTSKFSKFFQQSKNNKEINELLESITKKIDLKVLKIRESFDKGKKLIEGLSSQELADIKNHFGSITLEDKKEQVDWPALIDQLGLKTTFELIDLGDSKKLEKMALIGQFYNKELVEKEGIEGLKKSLMEPTNRDIQDLLKIKYQLPRRINSLFKNKQSESSGFSTGDYNKFTEYLKSIGQDQIAPNIRELKDKIASNVGEIQKATSKSTLLDPSKLVVSSNQLANFGPEIANLDPEIAIFNPKVYKRIINYTEEAKKISKTFNPNDPQSKEDIEKVEHMKKMASDLVQLMKKKKEDRERIFEIKKQLRFARSGRLESPQKELLERLLSQRLLILADHLDTKCFTIFTIIGRLFKESFRIIPEAYVKINSDLHGVPLSGSDWSRYFNFANIITVLSILFNGHVPAQVRPSDNFNKTTNLMIVKVVLEELISKIVEATIGVTSPLNLITNLLFYNPLAPIRELIKFALYTIVANFKTLLLIILLSKTTRRLRAASIVAIASIISQLLTLDLQGCIFRNPEKIPMSLDLVLEAQEDLFLALGLIVNIPFSFSRIIILINNLKYRPIRQIPLDLKIIKPHLFREFLDIFSLSNLDLVQVLRTLSGLKDNFDLDNFSPKFYRTNYRDPKYLGCSTTITRSLIEASFLDKLVVTIANFSDRVLRSIIQIVKDLLLANNLFISSQSEYKVTRTKKIVLIDRNKERFDKLEEGTYHGLKSEEDLEHLIFIDYDLLWSWILSKNFNYILSTKYDLETDLFEQINFRFGIKASKSEISCPFKPFTFESTKDKIKMLDNIVEGLFVRSAVDNIESYNYNLEKQFKNQLLKTRSELSLSGEENSLVEKALQILKELNCKFTIKDKIKVPIRILDLSKINGLEDYRDRNKQTIETINKILELQKEKNDPLIELLSGHFYLRQLVPLRIFRDIASLVIEGNSTQIKKTKQKFIDILASRSLNKKFKERSLKAQDFIRILEKNQKELYLADLLSELAGFEDQRRGAKIGELIFKAKIRDQMWPLTESDKKVETFKIRKSWPVKVILNHNDNNNYLFNLADVDQLELNQLEFTRPLRDTRELRDDLLSNTRANVEIVSNSHNSFEITTANSTLRDPLNHYQKKIAPDPFGLPNYQQNDNILRALAIYLLENDNQDASTDCTNQYQLTGQFEDSSIKELIISTTILNIWHLTITDRNSSNPISLLERTKIVLSLGRIILKTILLAIRPLVNLRSIVLNGLGSMNLLDIYHKKDSFDFMGDINFNG